MKIEKGFDHISVGTDGRTIIVTTASVEQPTMTGIKSY